MNFGLFYSVYHHQSSSLRVQTSPIVLVSDDSVRRRRTQHNPSGGKDAFSSGLEPRARRCAPRSASWSCAGCAGNPAAPPRRASTPTTSSKAAPCVGTKSKFATPKNDDLAKVNHVPLNLYHCVANFVEGSFLGVQNCKRAFQN